MAFVDVRSKSRPAPSMRREEMPVSDLSEKIYTNGHALQVGAQVYDPDSGNTYTVTQELGHNSIHPMKRYLVEARTGAAPKGGGGA